MLAPAGPAARGRLTGLVGGLAVVLALAVLRPRTGDEHLHRWLLGHRPTVLVQTLRWVTAVGSTPISVGIVVVGMGVAAAVGVHGRRLIVPPTAFGVGWVVRHLLAAEIGRARPPAADWLVHASGASYPSGHTFAATMAVLTVGGLHASRSARQRWSVVAAVVAAAVGSSRVVLGVHWPSDVVAGAALAVAVASASRMIEAPPPHVQPVTTCRNIRRWRTAG